MAEPPSPSVPSPFDPRPESRSGPGCSKPLLLGCGAVLVLLGIGAVVFVVEAPTLFRKILDSMAGSLEPRLPPDLTPQERQRLHAAFAAAGRAVENKKADLRKAQAFQRKLLAVSDPQKPLTRQDVLDLIRALEDLAGQSPSTAPPLSPPPTTTPKTHLVALHPLPAAA
ncbi:MAG TPA: hypothetical protein VHQ90_04080 [Thermoanaerobaculia bacterium]|nr:hypothetical protein [Thermoanaerobaculia bacterium]